MGRWSYRGGEEKDPVVMCIFVRRMCFVYQYQFSENSLPLLAWRSRISLSFANTTFYALLAMSLGTFLQKYICIFIKDSALNI